MVKNRESGEELKVVNLKCEYREAPLGVDVRQPRLSWVIESNKRNKAQKAYQILVASNKKKLEENQADLWNSGKVESDQSTNVVYKGKKLESGLCCYWKVRIWDEVDNISEYSRPDRWEMGLLSDNDWEGEWIGNGEQWKSGWAPLLRRELTVEKNIKKARVYICGLGYYELQINGKKVGDHVLDPGQTDYDQRVFYVTYDITDILNIGDNVLGIILGDGWYNQNRVWGGNLCYGQPRVILQLNLEFEDGSKRSIVTDKKWKITDSPITLNNIYGGETYDARLEKPNWSCPGFDDCDWSYAHLLEEPGGKFQVQKIPAIKKIQRFNPVSIRQPVQGVYVYDMGQNFSGWIRLTVQGPPGTEVVLRYAEKLGENGRIDPGTTGSKHTHLIQTDRYILKGDGIEVWEPRFTYHGFRYVEVTGLPGKAELDNIKGIFAHSSVEKSGSFNCSDKIFNKIHQTYKWTQLSNLHSIPEDCPARERCGWLGDAQITAESTIYNWEMPLFWAKYIRDIETSREINGHWMQIAPGKRLCGEATPAWGTAQVQLPWYLFLYYGDHRLLKEHYQAMKNWVKHLLKKSENYIVSFGLGDWCPPGGVGTVTTPVPLTSTGYFYFDTHIMKKIAYVLGEKKDYEWFKRLASNIKRAFNEEFFNSSTLSYGSQTANSFALYLGLVPADSKQAVADWVAKDIKRNNFHFTTGIIGIKYMFNMLTEYDYGDIAQKVLNQSTYPGFAYNFSQGATTLWETWERDETDPRSLNHPMQGGLDSWFYSHLGGIRPDYKNPGFKEFIIKPYLVGTINNVKVSYESMFGTINSSWRKNENKFELNVTIPVNTSAIIYLPVSDGKKVKEGNKPIGEVENIKFLGREAKRSLYKVGSGEYNFIVFD